jgi:hypothetical protein
MFIKWINLGLAITIRVVIIGIRIVFEYIVERVDKSTIYAFLAAISFIFSGHIMPNYDTILLMVLLVDVSILILLVIYAICIKCLSRRHNITLACRRVFYTLATILFILYCLFITAVALTNTV